MKWGKIAICSLFLLMLGAEFLRGPAAQFIADNDQSARFASKDQQINSIRLEGLKIVSQDLVFSTIDSQVTQDISPRTVSSDIKKLFALGFFQDIRVETTPASIDGLDLVYVLVERPSIRKIIFKGNTAFSSTVLTKELNVFPFSMTNRTNIETSMAKIRQKYIKKNYFHADISYELVPQDGNQIDLVYKIQESKKTYLTEVNITGPEYFHPLDIQRILTSAEIECATWVSSSGIYDLQRINTDLQIIRQTYFQEGFIDVFIDKPSIRLIDTGEFFRAEVDFKITEGAQHWVRSIRVKSADEFDLIVPEEEMIAAQPLQKDEVFNPFLMLRGQNAIQNMYKKRGYAFASVQTSYDIDKETHRVDLTYRVTRTEKRYIDRINFSGNTSTRDYVLRRELSIYDDELYDSDKLYGSRNTLLQLGYFTGIELLHQEDNQEDLDYEVKVTETQTGRINGTLRYTNSGLGIVLNVSKDNFLGKGQRISASVNASINGNQAFDISFHEPYFLDSNFSSTSRIFNTIRKVSEYKQQRTGFAQTFGYPIWNNWRVSLGYTYADIRFSDITEKGKISLDNITEAQARSLTMAVSYSSVNNPRFPSSGSEFVISTSEYGGSLLGGDYHYRRIGLNYRYFYPLTDSITFMGRYRAAQLQAAGGTIPFAARFTSGGITTVRGFKSGALSGGSSVAGFRDNFFPEDLNDASSDAFNQEDYNFYLRHKGGTLQSIFNFELLFPITREGNNMKGVIFFDAGNVWSAEKRMYEIVGAERDFLEYRTSYGIGARIITPAGVVRFEYGQKLDQRKREPGSEFHFHIGGLF